MSFGTFCLWSPKCSLWMRNMSSPSGDRNNSLLHAVMAGLTPMCTSKREKDLSNLSKHFQRHQSRQELKHCSSPTHFPETTDLFKRMWIQTLLLLAARSSSNPEPAQPWYHTINQAQQLVSGFISLRDTWFLKGTKKKFFSSRSSFSPCPSSYLEIPEATFQVGVPCLSLLPKYFKSYNVCLPLDLLFCWVRFHTKTPEMSGDSRSLKGDESCYQYVPLTHLGTKGELII